MQGVEMVNENQMHREKGWREGVEKKKKKWMEKEKRDTWGIWASLLDTMRTTP